MCKRVSNMMNMSIGLAWMDSNLKRDRDDGGGTGPMQRSDRDKVGASNVWLGKFSSAIEVNVVGLVSLIFGDLKRGPLSSCKEALFSLSSSALAIEACSSASWLEFKEAAVTRTAGPKSKKWQP